MRVIAIEKGYGGKPGNHQIREPGDEFEVEDGAHDVWYKPVNAKPTNKPAGGGKTVSKPAADDTDEIA